MRRLTWAAPGALLLAAPLWAMSCASPPTVRSLATDAATAMGGLDRLRGLQTVAMKGGTGTRLRLGQMAHATDAEMPASLTNVVETVDLATGRAALDYEITLADFHQHRQEVLTKRNGKAVGLENVAGRPLAVTSPSGLFSWGTQNSPEFLLDPNAVLIITFEQQSAAAQNNLALPEAQEGLEFDGIGGNGMRGHLLQPQAERIAGRFRNSSFRYRFVAAQLHDGQIP